MKTVLFIGGPIDGHRVEMSAPLPEKTTTPYDTHHTLEDGRALTLAATQAPRLAVYELRPFQINDSTFLPVYCFKPLTNEQVMRALLEGYRAN